MGNLHEVPTMFVNNMSNAWLLLAMEVGGNTGSVFLNLGEVFVDLLRISTHSRTQLK